MRDIDVSLVSPSLATLESLSRATKFVARDTRMFLEDNRNISCLCNIQMIGGHSVHLSLACLVALGDTPNTVSHVASLLV